MNGYRIIHKIKDGSIGTVWLAANRRNEDVALKQISPEKAALPRKIRAFRKEAELTKSLDHPHIIRVHEYVDVRPQPFFTMEYFDSENLKYAIARQPERVSGREFRILAQVADALAYVHSLGIIHKDLKPENVLLSAAGEIRLIDFSLAQTKWDRWLQFGRRVEGTPMYMAPEQRRGERCDARTDIYAFGLLAYEVIAKRMPKHERETPSPVCPSPALNGFILRMLEKRPEKRYPDMAAVQYELHKWMKRDSTILRKQVVGA